MTLIVGQVMTGEVVGARREMSFKDVARLLDRYRISGLPVVDDDDKVVGVISETDLLRVRAVRSGGERQPRPGPLPSRRGLTSPRRGLPSLRRGLPSLRRGLPSLRRGLFSLRRGLFSLCGTLPRSADSDGPWRAAARRSAGDGGGAVRPSTAEQLMSTPAITVHPEQRVADAARVMERHRVERLPVVDEEDRLIGIATRRDLLRVFLRTDEEIRREIADDVLGRALSLPPPHSVIVSVGEGVVTLEGRLERRSEIPEAIRRTWRVDGVVGVMNSLTFRVDDTHPAERHPSHRIEHHWLPER
ncbi:CBS domain-containing protein [Streptomyces sp. NPDC002667]|uniref:CBS domain-containing protein n=1 Tax=Streptomyces sp. NPDC002667 TaxID=3364657 RepID=UPI0036BDB3F2